jgi:hypothetical protein
MNETDEKLVQKAKEAFDASVDGLDAATLSRLNRGRHAALEAATRPNSVWMNWMPATGVAAAVLIAVFALRGPADMEVISAPATDLEILLSEESIEMLEDLEFYSWLDALELDGDGDLG